MLRRFRRLYAEQSGYHSPLEDYPGLVEEMKHALETLSPETRLAYDAKVLPAVLGGPFAPIVRHLARRFPKMARASFTRLIPPGLRYLIGPSFRVLITESQPREPAHAKIQIPRCRFYSEGGKRLCQEVCKSPTEYFFAHEYQMKIRFSPKFEDGSCTIDFN